MKISRNDLLTALEFVGGGVEPTDQGEWASYIWLAPSGVYFYNGESWAFVQKDLEGIFEHGLAEDVAVGVPGKEFSDLIADMSDEELDLVYNKNNELIVEGCDSHWMKAGWGTVQREDFPFAAFVDKVRFFEVADGFVDALACAVPIATDDPDQFTFDCVRVSDVGVLSANRILVFSWHPSEGSCCNGKSAELAIPAKLLKIMLKSKIDLDVFGFDEQWVYFKMKDGEGVLGLRRIEGVYPDNLGTLLGLEGDEVNVEKGFLEAINRSGALLTSLSGDMVEVICRSNGVKISSRGERGWYEEEVAASYEGAPIQFTLSLKVVNAMMKVGHEILLSKDERNLHLLIIRSEDAECVTPVTFEQATDDGAGVGRQYDEEEEEPREAKPKGIRKSTKKRRSRKRPRSRENQK